MTAQLPDSIVLDGEQWRLLDTPLDRWLASLPDVPAFVAPHTANWRGYVARWRIHEGWLYLEDIEATVPLPDGTRAQISGRQALNGRPLPLRADFVSGRFRIGRGEQIRHVHSGFASRWEEEMELDIEAGRLTASRRLARASAMGSAGPYRLDAPLDEMVSGGAFGQLIAASAPDGLPVVAKVARPNGGAGATIIRFGSGLPYHHPALAFAPDPAGSHIQAAGPAQLEAVLRNEAAILEQDAGVLFPRSYGLWSHDPSGQPVLVMERLEGDRPSTPQDVVALLAALVDAVDRGAIDSHGDVKMEHVFIADGRVRLCDPAPRFAEAGWRGFTPTYNPYGLTGPASDVAACATILRYLPGTTAGWRWCDEVLRGPQPPAWAHIHREALGELRRQLAEDSPPPAGWTCPPLPDETALRGVRPDVGPAVPLPPSGPASASPSWTLEPVNTGFPFLPPPEPSTASDLDDVPTFAALALAVRASVIEETGNPQNPVFVEQAATSEQSLRTLLDALALTITRNAAAWRVELEDAPSVTLLVKPATWGAARGITARMVSMLPREPTAYFEADQQVQAAWNHAVALELDAALLALDHAVAALPGAGDPPPTRAIIETAQHLGAILDVLLHDHLRFVDEE